MVGTLSPIDCSQNGARSSRTIGKVPTPPRPRALHERNRCPPGAARARGRIGRRRAGRARLEPGRCQLGQRRSPAPGRRTCQHRGLSVGPCGTGAATAARARCALAQRSASAGAPRLRHGAGRRRPGVAGRDRRQRARRRPAAEPARATGLGPGGLEPAGLRGAGRLGRRRGREAEASAQGRLGCSVARQCEPRSCAAHLRLGRALERGANGPHQGPPPGRLAAAERTAAGASPGRGDACGSRTAGPGGDRVDVPRRPGLRLPRRLGQHLARAGPGRGRSAHRVRPLCHGCRHRLARHRRAVAAALVRRQQR